MNKIGNSFLLLTVFFYVGCASKSYPELQKEAEVKNVILLIGDGMGLSQVSTAFFYNTQTSNFQRFNSIGLIKTSSATDLITDSAAGATSFSTGVKTYNGAIGMNKDSLPQKTIVEVVSKKGMKTGIIATSSITHATPASFYAHVKSRELPEEIATWLPESDLDYFAAGGLKFFSGRKDNIDYVQKLEDNGFIIQTKQLNSEKPLNSNQKYGFLIAEDGLPKASEGRGDFLINATQHALSFLSQNKEGFFLMIEGSQIDWGGHENDADFIINEVKDFDKAIGVALNFAAKNGETLVIVTADHETGGFTLASSKKIYNKGITVNDYNIIVPSFSTKGHSASLIPVFAYGPQRNLFTGIYENNEIFGKILEALRISQ